jgi:hypothetical protein
MARVAVMPERLVSAPQERERVEAGRNSETETVLDPVDRRAWQGLGESLKASGHVRRLALKWQ